MRLVRNRQGVHTKSCIRDLTTSCRWLRQKTAVWCGGSGWGRSDVGGRRRMLYELGHDVIMSSVVVYLCFTVALIGMQRMRWKRWSVWRYCCNEFMTTLLICPFTSGDGGSISSLATVSEARRAPNTPTYQPSRLQCKDAADTLFVCFFHCSCMKRASATAHSTNIYRLFTVWPNSCIYPNEESYVGLLGQK